MSPNTRGKFSTAFTTLIGPSKDLPVSDLATRRDVLQQALHLRLQDPRDVRNYPKAEVIVDTVKLVKENWFKINKQISEYPVIVSDQEIERRVTTLWNKVEEFTSKKGGGGKIARKKSELKRKKKTDF